MKKIDAKIEKVKRDEAMMKKNLLKLGKRKEPESKKKVMEEEEEEAKKKKLCLSSRK